MTTLNSFQQQSYSKAQQLARFLRKSKRIYKDVTPFRNEVTTFLQHLDSIEEQATIKATKGIAITAQKKAFKKSLAREAADVCMLATAYALSTNNRTLLYNLRSTTFTHIYTTHDHLMYINIQCIRHIIEPLLENEEFKSYGITADSLTSITDKATQFGRMIGHGESINRHSHYASQNITSTLKKISLNIKQMQRLLILFKATHPGFIEEFKQALIIEEKKASHNTLEGTIIDSHTAQPLENVTITAEATNKKTVTSSNGFYHIRSIKAGSHIITISAEGYITQTIKVKIARGKTTTLAVTLHAKAFSLPASEVA